MNNIIQFSHLKTSQYFFYKQKHIRQQHMGKILSIQLQGYNGAWNFAWVTVACLLAIVAHLAVTHKCLVDECLPTHVIW